MGKKTSKTIIVLILCICVLSALSGCLGGREINDLEIVIGMGVDKDKDTGRILITAQVVKEAAVGRSSGNGGGDGMAFWNVSSTGNSVFDAIRQITHKTGNRLFVSHNHVVIFGKEVAAEGLQKYIDFFLRAHEMRPTAMILVAEGRAADVMDAKPETEKFPAMNISKLAKSYGFTSHIYKVNMKDFASNLMSPASAALAPLVDTSHGRDKESRDINVSGMAVFKNGEMVGILNHDEVRGLLWVIGEVKSGVLFVTSPGGQGNAVLEIIKAKSRVTPEIKDGKIIMHIEVKEESSLSEQTTAENLATDEAFEKLQKATEEIIRHEILATFEKSRELKADIFGFGEMLHKKYSKEWKDIKDNWDEIYPTVELDIAIESKIMKTDLLKKPASPDEKEK